MTTCISSLDVLSWQPYETWRKCVKKFVQSMDTNIFYILFCYVYYLYFTAFDFDSIVPRQVSFPSPEHWKFLRPWTKRLWGMSVRNRLTSLCKIAPQIAFLDNAMKLGYLLLWMKVIFYLLFVSGVLYLKCPALFITTTRSNRVIVTAYSGEKCSL